MPASNNQQVVFASLNASSAPHLLQEGEVATATNVDFSLEFGGLVCRRGVSRLGTIGAAQAVTVIGRNYTADAIDDSPWYATGTALMARGTGSATTLTLSSIGSGSGRGVIGFYKNNAYIGLGTVGKRDDGTNTFNWIIETPTSPPQVVLTTLTASFVGFNGTFTASEGTVVSAAGSPWVINTCTTADAGTRITLTAALGTNTNWENPTTFEMFGLNTSGTKTSTIGVFGVDYLLLGVNKPNSIIRISRDVSIGDATFQNFWHAETTIADVQAGIPDPIGQTLAAVFDQEFTQAQLDLFNSAPLRVRRKLRGEPGGDPISYIASIQSGYTPWAVPRTDYQFVGASTSPSWENCQAIRVIIEATEGFAAYVGGWQTWGDKRSSITDTINGIQYYYSLARVENGEVTHEGGISPASTPKKIQGAGGQLTIGPYNGSSTSGANYYGIYRQGGLLQDAHLIDYFPIGTSTGTVNKFVQDIGYIDLDVINNPEPIRDVWGTFTALSAVSEPFYERLFLGSGNTLWWTAPGMPTLVQNETETLVSNSGDDIQGFQVWGRLVIINQNSVYEFDGNVFEGEEADWALRKSGSRRGSVAPKSIIKTPHGILLVGYDGLSLYTPGYGVDQNLDWVDDKILDAWRGTGSNAPAAQKGSRVPAIDLAYIQNSCAMWADSKIYLAVPTTGHSSGNPNTVFVLNFKNKTVSIYSYPHTGITYLFWDQVQNRAVAGSALGGLFLLESGLVDVYDTSSQGITWRARTKQWTTSQDLVLENLSIESVSDPTIEVVGLVDGTSTTTLGTLTNTIKQWSPLALNGVVSNNVSFNFLGSSSGGRENGVYGLQWQNLFQPAKVTYWRSEFDNGGSDEQKIWDVHFDELEVLGTGTVTSVTFVDNTAVSTQLITGPTNGNTLNPKAFPNETYGYIAYTTYTATGGVQFKLYKTYNSCRAEPAPVSNYVTSRFSYGEGASHDGATQECWYHDVLTDINCQGNTVLGTVMVDNTAVSTFTYSGSGRSGFNKNLPEETYGKVIYVIYNASSGTFKHYTTYYDLDVEPNRDIFSESPYEILPSEGYLKTWLPTLNPQGGTLLGTMVVDGVALMTATFTGSVRKTYEIGTPNVSTGKSIKALYNSSTPFKHYNTQWESLPKPFGKKTWVINYFRPQGGSQVAMGRFYTLDLEAAQSGTVTSTWKVDGTAVTTNTHTVASGRNVFDQISFPPGARGYLFQQELTSSIDFKVWRTNIDIENITVKGLVRNVVSGTPDDRREAR